MICALLKVVAKLLVEAFVSPPPVSLAAASLIALLVEDCSDASADSCWPTYCLV